MNMYIRRVHWMLNHDGGRPVKAAFYVPKTLGAISGILLKLLS